MEPVIIVARLLLALVFALAGLTKLADRQGSRQGLIEFGLPSSLAGPLGLLLPLAELAVALALLPVASAWWGAVGALLLLLIFIGGIANSLARGKTPECRCFGQLHSAPIGRSTLYRNLVLVALALIVLTGGPANQPSLTDWLLQLSTNQLILVGFGLVGLSLLATATWLLFQLARHGRALLTRLESLDARLGSLSGPLPASAPIPTPNGQLASDPAQGLPVGAGAPGFQLPAISGVTVDLAELRAEGRPVLLLFMDPNCGPCNALLPDVGRWQRGYAAEATIAVISRGTPDANRAKFAEHEITTVLLQQEYEVADAFRAHGTPAAVLVRADGTVGSPVALGSDQIRTLVWAALLTPLSFVPTDSGPPGLPIGEPAPALTFVDLTGQSVALADFLGGPLLLLFWSNGCGFCQQMLPDLQRWDANPPEGAPRMLVISNGSAEENRALGLRSTVVLDATSAASVAFQANGTPMAVLLDAEGRVASRLTVGAKAVLALVDPAAPSPSAHS